MDKLLQLKERLRELVRNGNGLALAFSGGVDSCFLLAVLAGLRGERSFKLLLLTMHSRFQQKQELEDAAAAAAMYGLELRRFDCDPLALPELAGNPVDRCYHCKKHIFSAFLRFAAEQGVNVLIDGTNHDDLLRYRPGRRALTELGVLSPLADCAIGKAELRQIARSMGLECAGKPSNPCLATRFEYGEMLDAVMLERVASGEAAIKKFLPGGADLRLRVHSGGRVARIEVPPECFQDLLRHRAAIALVLHELGFLHVALDIDGFCSGSMDKGLTIKEV